VIEISPLLLAFLDPMNTDLPLAGLKEIVTNLDLSLRSKSSLILLSPATSSLTLAICFAEEVAEFVAVGVVLVVVTETGE